MFDLVFEQPNSSNALSNDKDFSSVQSIDVNRLNFTTSPRLLLSLFFIFLQISSSCFLAAVSFRTYVTFILIFYILFFYSNIEIIITTEFFSIVSNTLQLYVNPNTDYFYTI